MHDKVRHLESRKQGLLDSLTAFSHTIENSNFVAPIEAKLDALSDRLRRVELLKEALAARVAAKQSALRNERSRMQTMIASAQTERDQLVRAQ